LSIPAMESERRARHTSERAGRHIGGESDENFARGFTALGSLAVRGVQVSARAADLASGRVLFSVDDHVVMPTASIGKVLLLVEVAARLADPGFNGYTILDREAGDFVGDSGIWQHLQAPSLPIADLAALVGATSDNLATNVLIRTVGLEAVRARTEKLGLKRTALLDLVRDHRGPDDHGILLVNKTGADGGVRAEVGVLRGPRTAVTYAVSMYFADTNLQTRLAVLDGMRQVGLDLLEYVH
jgi:beta-lactamase class A